MVIQQICGAPNCNSVLENDIYNFYVYHQTVIQSIFTNLLNVNSVVHTKIVNIYLFPKSAEFPLSWLHPIANANGIGGISGTLFYHEARVMFSQAPVILSTGVQVVHAPTPLRGECVCIRACIWARVCVCQHAIGQASVDRGCTSTPPVGTHPTEMHSCCMCTNFERFNPITATNQKYNSPVPLK